MKRILIKRTFLHRTIINRSMTIGALQLCTAASLLGQMAGMPHPDPSAVIPVTKPSNVTFTKDVAPILQQNCQSCHRPGEGAPFSMITYEDARPWATLMKQMVVTRAMPPWFEDGHTEKFENDRRLTQAQIDMIAAWVDAGAPKGDPKDMPPAHDWVAGWTIPKPDKIYQLPQPFPIPATGVLQYQYVIVPTGFTKDTWVQDVEAAPTDRSVVHHIVAYVRRPGSNYFKGMPTETFFEAPPAKTGEKAAKDDVPSDWLAGYAPGQPPDMFVPGEAKLIPAGSDIVLELHYMPEGKATTDQANLGLVLAKDSPKDRVMTLQALNQDIKIPAGDPDYKAEASFTLQREVTLLGMHPHMHTRGKSMSYRLVFPNGETRDVLNVPHYNWRWQLWYNLEKPIVLPAGTRIECTAHYDNSAQNPDNPDPTKTITWGQQSFDEMMVCFFNVAFPAGTPSKELLPAPKTETASR